MHPPKPSAGGRESVVTKASRKPEMPIFAGMLKRLEIICASPTPITDQKALYAALSRQLFGDQVAHLAYSGKLARTTWNPHPSTVEAEMREVLAALS